MTIIRNCAALAAASAAVGVGAVRVVGAERPGAVTTLDQRSIAPFVESFNASAGSPRLVALLSGTCPYCIAGARAMRERVLNAHPEADLRVFVVWLPMLGGDSAQTSAESSDIFAGDPRVIQFYDPDRLLGAQISAQLLRKGAGPAWDIYLAYSPDAVWREQAPPEPADWMHQLSGDRRADPARFRTGKSLADGLSDMADALLDHAPRRRDRDAAVKGNGPRVELLWFGSCPNHKAMRAALAQAASRLGEGAAWRDVDLESLPLSDRRRGYPSPTILVDGVDLFGAASPSDTALKCRIYPGGMPDASAIEAKLQRALAAGSTGAAPG